MNQDVILAEMRNGTYVPFHRFVESGRQTATVQYDISFGIGPFLDSYTKNLESGCPVAASHMMPRINELKNFNENELVHIEDFQELDSKLSSILSILMPSMVFSDEILGVHSPFTPDFKYSTPRMKDYIIDPHWEICINQMVHNIGSGMTTTKAAMHILNTLYGQKIDLLANLKIKLRNTKTGLIRHYSISNNLDYVQVHVNGDLPDLSLNDIQHLIRNIDDPALWLDKLPSDKFSFEGFMISKLVDVTRAKTVTDIKELTANLSEDIKAGDYIASLEQLIGDFFQYPNLKVGLVNIGFADLFDDVSFSICNKKNHRIIRDIDDDKAGIYSKVIAQCKPLVIEDLTTLKGPTKLEQGLLKNGVKSIVLLPMFHNEEIDSLIEIGAPEANVFDALTPQYMQPVYEVLAYNNNNYLEELEHRTNNFIQSQFTSIHPSVKWRFEEVSRTYQISSTLGEFTGDIDSIVFKDVFPLFGQADIVGSSRKRNLGIQADLVDNLTRLSDLLDSWLEVMDIHLLRAYTNRMAKHNLRITENFVTSDESIIVDLLTNEVHPFIHQLAMRFPALPKDKYEDYFNYLDKNLGIVYRERKKYERSVSKLNQAMSEYIEKDNAELQLILPHYFEKYKTDGVEYNMYIGQSIVPNIKFEDYYLKEFKVRQLVQLCKVTQLVQRLSPELDVPLDTAQLVFAYNHTLSIRFRMDEKQFDVDGAYNVRYEILKKRIDKAIVKGTNERLTLGGKIAIVYLQDTDRREYMEYIDYLIACNLIEKDYEVLELEKLQGAEGLKAMRLTVKKEENVELQIEDIQDHVMV